MALPRGRRWEKPFPIPHSLKARDRNKRYQEFNSLARRRGLIVLFSRSPYCKHQAVAWNKHFDEFRALDYNVALVSYDPVAVHAQFGAVNKIAYSLLSDEGSRIIRVFGLINQLFAPSSPWHGLTHSMIFAIDPRGVITHRISSVDYRSCLDVATLLPELKKAAGE